MTVFGTYATCPTCAGQRFIFAGLPAEGEPGIGPQPRRPHFRPAKSELPPRRSDLASSPVYVTCPTCTGRAKVLAADLSIDPDAEGVPGMPTVD